MAKVANFTDYIKTSVNETLNNFKIDGSEKGIFMNILSTISITFVNFLDYSNVQPVILKAIALAMVANIVTGVWKSKKLGVGYKGKVMLAGVFEKMIYLLVFLSTAFVIRAFGYEYEWLVTTIFAVLGLSEISSAWTNVQIAKTGKQIEDVDIITMLSKLVRAIIKGIIDFAFSKLKTNAKALKDTETENKQDTE